MPSLLLPVREDLYAIDLAAAREVLELGPGRPLTPVPGAAAAILGVVNVRGEVVCVLDLAVLLGRPALTEAERVALVVVGLRRGSAALATSALPWRAELDADAAGLRSAGDGAFVPLDLEAVLDRGRVER